MALNPASSEPTDIEVIPACKPGDTECWNRIGVSGDRTCSELESFIHCRNCPVFAAAAGSFFDRPAPPGYLDSWARWLAGSLGGDRDELSSNEEANESAPLDVKVSVLIFRLGVEWLSFRTRAVAEVTMARPVHSVPHRTNDVFLGLVNVQGQVQLYVSLHGLLGLTDSSTPGRLVVLRGRARAESWVFAADEVHGVEHIARGQWRSVPATLVNPAVGFSEAVFSWKEHTIGLLDEARVVMAFSQHCGG